MNLISVQIVIGKVRWEEGRESITFFLPQYDGNMVYCMISNKASVVFPPLLNVYLSLSRTNNSLLSTNAYCIMLLFIRI